MLHGSAGVSVEYLSATKPADVPVALGSVNKLRVQALVVSADAVIRGQMLEVTQFAAKARVPAVYFAEDFVRAGGLMSYGASRRTLGRHAAVYVDKILKGAKPALLPVEQPTKFDLAINLKAARALGLTVPPALLLQADRSSTSVSDFRPARRQLLDVMRRAG
jgi:putative tryptophan/tyrosine transport system substrate-binding protein